MVMAIHLHVKGVRMWGSGDDGGDLWKQIVQLAGQEVEEMSVRDCPTKDVRAGRTGLVQVRGKPAGVPADALYLGYTWAGD